MLIKKPLLLITLVFSSCAHYTQLEQAHQKSKLGEFEGAMIAYQALGEDEYVVESKKQWKLQQYHRLQLAIEKDLSQICPIFEGLSKHQETPFFEESLIQLISQQLKNLLKVTKQELVFYTQFFKKLSEVYESPQTEACHTQMTPMIERIKAVFKPKLQDTWVDKISKNEASQLIYSAQHLNQIDRNEYLPNDWEKSMLTATLSAHESYLKAFEQDLKADQNQSRLPWGKIFLHTTAIDHLSQTLKINHDQHKSLQNTAQKILLKQIALRLSSNLPLNHLETQISGILLLDENDKIDTASVFDLGLDLKLHVGTQHCDLSQEQAQKQQRQISKTQIVDNPDWVSAQAKLKEDAKSYHQRIKVLDQLYTEQNQLQIAISNATDPQQIQALEMSYHHVSRLIIEAEHKEKIKRDALLQAKSELLQKTSKIAKPSYQVLQYPTVVLSKHCELPWEIEWRQVGQKTVKFSGFVMSSVHHEMNLRSHQKASLDQIHFEKDEDALLMENQQKVVSEIKHLIETRKDEMVTILKNQLLQKQQVDELAFENTLVSLYLISPISMQFTMSLYFSKKINQAQNQLLVDSLKQKSMPLAQMHQKILTKIEQQQNAKSQITFISNQKIDDVTKQGAFAVPASQPSSQNHQTKAVYDQGAQELILDEIVVESRSKQRKPHTSKSQGLPKLPQGLDLKKIENKIKKNEKIQDVDLDLTSIE